LQTKYELTILEEEAKGNNQTIVDDNAAQTLSHEDIENLKKQKSGKELVDALVQNSKSFENKTQFSQQKYLNRKKKKYMTTLRITNI
jgi:tRNA (adenine-N(1)-)-methyltransferase non-catalytic subunit